MPILETKAAGSAQGFGGIGAKASSGPVTYIEDVFSTYLYTGNGSTQTITNGIDLAGKGGLVWTKNRGRGTSANLIDTVRGVTKKVVPSSTAAEATVSYMTSFNSTGYTINGNNDEMNLSSDTYASWTFRKQPKFFDVVTWTGDGTGTSRTLNHNLGSTPGFYVCKATSTTGDWIVGVPSLGQNSWGLLNSNSNFGNNTTYWQAATSTTFGPQNTGGSNLLNVSGVSYVAYLFAHNAGGFGLSGTDNVISCGSFTSTGSVLSVNLGYEPQWLLYKESSNPGDWKLIDSMRGFQVDRNGSTVQLNPNLSAAESALGIVGPTATGFTFDNGGSGVTYIYIAIRRGPMKVPTTGTSVFSPVAYTGNSSTQTLNGFGFPPSAVLLKNRSSTASTGSYFVDKLRGGDALLNTPTTGAELVGFGTTTFNQDGITLPSLLNTNGSGTTYINWAFQRAPSFFDEVCYTGTGVARTVNHNLGVAPELMFVCRRSGGVGFMVYSANYGTSGYSILNSTEPFSTAYWGNASIIWNNTAPTSTVFSVGTSGTVNISADNFVAYLFASCPGVSKVGSYTGNGSSLNIDCGFTNGARFVLIKRTDSTGDWYVLDSARGISPGADPYLVLNSTAAEVTTNNYLSTYAAGFNLSAGGGLTTNISGATYIFLAIA